jgi:hypothetical protein
MTLRAADHEDLLRGCPLEEIADPSLDHPRPDARAIDINVRARVDVDAHGFRGRAPRGGRSLAEALMATCRALEAEIEHARTHATHLLQAVLKEAFAPAAS